MRNLFKLAFKTQLRNKTTIFNVLFITLALVIVIFVNTYSDAAMNYLESNERYNSVYFHSLEINPNGDDLDTGIAKVMGIEHVTVATKFYEYDAIMHSGELSNDKLDGSVMFFYANNNSLPEITEGTNFPEETGNYIICPENLYSTSNTNNFNKISKFSVIKMKDYLNKDLDFTYYSIGTKKEFQETYKLIGLYQTKGDLDLNICFTQVNNLTRIVENEYSDYIDGETGLSKINDQDTIIIQFDDISNLEEIKEKLDELNYIYKDAALVDTDYFYNIQNNAVKISYITLIITLFIVVLISLKQFDEDKKFWELLKYLGYKRKERNMLTIMSNIIQTIISICFTAIIFGTIYVVFNIILNIYPYILNGWTININFISTLLVLFVILIGTTIGIVINLFRME
jgi:hypothetical protein